MVEADNPCLVLLASSQALKVLVGVGRSDVFGQPLGFRYPPLKSELGGWSACTPLRPSSPASTSLQWAAHYLSRGGCEKAIRPFWQLKSDCVRVSRTSHRCLLPQHSLLRSASPRAPHFSEAPALLLPLKAPTWLCGPTFRLSVAGRREEAAGSSACLQNKEVHCYPLSTQRLSGPDKRAWAPWVTEMDGDPRAHAPHTLPVCVSLPLGSA